MVRMVLMRVLVLVEIRVEQHFLTGWGAEICWLERVVEVHWMRRWRVGGRQWRRRPSAFTAMTSAAEVEASDENNEWNEDSHEDNTNVVSFRHSCEGHELR
jgi:hypothetical protein